MHALFNNRVISLLILFASFFLISADLHFNTSASMRYKDIKIKYLDKTVTANLDSPGVKLKKYPNGRLEKLTIHKINSVIEIYFHELENGAEKVALIQNFRVYNGLLLLDGPLEKLSTKGNLMSQSNWHKGYLQGRQIIYNDDQKLAEEQWYDQGYPVKSWKLFYSSGQVASNITFPKSMESWKKTLVKNKKFKGATNKVQSSPYFQHSIEAKETWYSSLGKKRRETVYKISKTPDSFLAVPTGEFYTFGDNGEIVSQEKLYRGTGVEEHIYTSLGRTYHKRDSWLNGRLFKSQDYVILAEEDLINE
jgi:antitoxin component YwqK of YwqJK toxin-antitoxin module